MAPTGHMFVHTLAVHCCRAVHTVPQVPQFELLDTVSTHVPLHIVCPAGHVHTLLTHDDPPPQAMPHEPQLVLLERVSTQLPLQKT